MKLQIVIPKRTRRSGGRLWSELLASDPGLMRLRSACRTTLASVLAAAILGFMLAEGAVSPLGLGSGIVFALMAASLPRDPSPRQRLITIVTMALSGALSTVVTGLLAIWPLVGEAGFVALLFGAVAVQTRGPRAVAGGLMAVVASYLALFLHADPAHVPSALLGYGVALGVVLLVGFVVVPERSPAALKRIIRTVEHHGAMLLHAVGAEPDPALRLRQRRLFADLNETILAAEDQLAVLEPEAALRLSSMLLRLELALAQVAEEAAATPLPRADRARIRLTAMRLNASRWSPLRMRDSSASALTAALDEVERAADHLSRAVLPEPRRPGATPSFGAWASRKRPRPAWRQATRAGLAVVISMVAGHLISPDRWFWAVLTAYLVFLNARSRGETIFKGVQRVWGTVAGLLVGVVVSVALSGHVYSQAAGLVVCVFGLAYVFAISQTLAIFCVTVFLGLLYSLLGAQAETILVLRLEETAIGAAAAILVEIFVLPTRTRDVVHAIGGRLLVTLAEVMRLSARHLATGEANPVATMRQADRHFRDLRAALRPLQASRALVWWGRPPAELPAILSCVFWVRSFATGSQVERPAGDLAPILARAERTAVRLAGLAGHSPVPAEAAVEARVPSGHADTTSLHAALDNLEGILDVLGERLTTEGWNALVSKRPI